MKDYDLILARLYASVFGQDYNWCFEDTKPLVGEVDFHITKTHLNGEEHKYNRRDILVLDLIGYGDLYTNTLQITEENLALDLLTESDLETLFRTTGGGNYFKSQLRSLANGLEILKDLDYKVVKE